MKGTETVNMNNISESQGNGKISLMKRINRKRYEDIMNKSILTFIVYNLLIMKKVKKFFLRNYLIILFLAVIVFIGFISVIKAAFTKPHYIYARVKVSQGLWWANTARPQIWMIQSLKKGLKETDLLGNPIAEVLSVEHYPWFQQGTSYDAYMTLKLKVTEGKNGYQFARAPIAVGSAVSFEFPTLSISGTVINMSEKPIKKTYEEKIVYLSKSYALDWEYNDIMIGDKYFNGEETVFTILDKSAVDEYSTILNFAPVYTDSAVSAANYPQVRKMITVKAKIKVQKIDGYYVFAEEQVISTGKDIFLALPSVILNNYKVVKIE